MKAKGIVEVSGKLGNVTGQQRKTGAVISKIGIPYEKSRETRSTAQQAQNTAYREAVAAWNALTQEQQENYIDMAINDKISGINYFIRQVLTTTTAEYGTAKYGNAKYS